MLRNKNIFFIKSIILNLLFLIDFNVSANPLNPNGIYTKSIKHPSVDNAYNTIPETVGPYFLYIPDNIINSTNPECNIKVIVTAKTSIGTFEMMASPSTYLLDGFSSIYNLGVVKSYTVTRNSSKHCNDTLLDFGVKYGRFSVRYINVFATQVSSSGYADMCLRIFVNEKEVGTTCSNHVAEIPVLPSCDIFMPLTLSHGEVNANNVNGNIAKVNGDITCTGDMSATFQFLPKNEVDLSQGVKSHLDVCVSGKCMSNNVVQAEIKKNTHLAFSVNSTLSALGNPEPGSRVGNAILSIVIN